MFDIGFFELVIIFVLGLIVLGPERLPRVARGVGRWIGKARRTARNLQYELQRELDLEELRRRSEAHPINRDRAGSGGAAQTSTPPAAPTSGAPAAAVPPQPGVSPAAGAPSSTTASRDAGVTADGASSAAPEADARERRDG